MVELVYYELRGRSCRKILRRNGSPHKLLLFPEESWARSATTAYWLLSVSWWSRSRCRITEVSGSHKRSTNAKIQEIDDSTICIIGSFKTGTESDFKSLGNSGSRSSHVLCQAIIAGKEKLRTNFLPVSPLNQDSMIQCALGKALVLTSNVAQADFNMGYSLTGLLERGDRNKYGLQPSHFVAVKRKEWEPEAPTKMYHVYSNYSSTSLFDIYDNP